MAQYIETLLGPVVRKLDSAIHWTVILSTATERHKNNDIGNFERTTDQKQIHLENTAI